MMCYKDKTFCEFSKCNKWNSCHRALTQEEIDNATKWWGNVNAPIAIFVDKPDCYEEKP